MAQKYGMSIKTPKDIRRAATRIINEILKSDDLVTHAGRFASAAHVWLKSWELDKMSDIEKRLEALEDSTKEARR